ncbi:MAG TPA: MBL fold metallo-hydrolase [Candidatus Blautia excrementipullorum]|nr:MBL fold metallo-hydrolase [Candidatus Blautia excrementipullorum]
MHITWLGHSCFKIEKGGYSVIIDPYKDGSVPGLKNIRESADMVICSHEHGDHNGRECVRVTEKTDCPFKIISLLSFHDDAGGTRRGESAITILEDGDERIAHFGDLGCALTEEQESLLTDLDLALIPVGGFYTIDGKTAGEIVKKIHPRKVIPMHYRDVDKGYGYAEISTVDDFLQSVGSAVFLEASSMDTEKDYSTQMIVLEPENI